METQIEDIISEYLDLLNEGGPTPPVENFLASFSGLTPDVASGLTNTLSSLSALRAQSPGDTRRSAGWEVLRARMAAEPLESVAAPTVLVGEPSPSPEPTPLKANTEWPTGISKLGAWRPVLTGLGLAAAIILVLLASIVSRSSGTTPAAISVTDDPYVILRKAAQANLTVPPGKVRHLVYKYLKTGDTNAGQYAPMPWQDELWLSYDGSKPLMRGETRAISYLALMDQSYYWVNDPFASKDSVTRYPADPRIVTAYAINLNPIRMMLSLPDVRVAGPDVVDGRSTIRLDRIYNGLSSPTNDPTDYRLWVDPRTLEIVQAQRTMRDFPNVASQGKETVGTDTLVLDELKDRAQFPADLFTFHIPAGLSVTVSSMSDLGNDPILDPTPMTAASIPSPTIVSGGQQPLTPTVEVPVPRMPLGLFKIMYDDPSLRPLIVDVRPLNEFNQGHIAGAVSLPEADIDARAGDLPKGKLVMLYDDSPGGAVAQRVAVKLHSQYLFDYQFLKVLEGGWSAWQHARSGNAAYPVEGGAAPLPTRTPDAWATLRSRSLNVPGIQQSGRCPVTQGKQVIAGLPPLLGSGPIYPMGLYPGDGTTLYLDNADNNGLYSTKITWLGDPRYTGDPVLVRGGQINGPGKVHFQLAYNDPISDELLLDGDNGSFSSSVPSGWQNWPVGVYLPGPGCYALQVDSEKFSETIVFQALKK